MPCPLYPAVSWAADVLVCPLEIPIPIPNPAAAGLSPAAPMELAKWLGEAGNGRLCDRTPPVFRPIWGAC